MKVLVYGSGGRDHCLCEAYADSQHVDKVYFAPGNPGIMHTYRGWGGLIERVRTANFTELVDFCHAKRVDLVDVGSENPLERGLIDNLVRAGIRCVGAKKHQVVLESDRKYTNEMLDRIYVPKPKWRSFIDRDDARQYVKSVDNQVVVKANGLAAGKGAIVCDDVDDALAAIDHIMVKRAFGDAGDTIIIEDRKYGTELSFYVYLDGRNVWPLRMLAQDYKQAFDESDVAAIEQFGGNLNTGGTGSYCPHKMFSSQLTDRIMRDIVNPFVNYIYNQLGWSYKGVLYFGLNRDPSGNLDVFEVNVRHGDPEWEVIAGKLVTDLFEIGMAVWDGTLDQVEQVWDDRYWVDVVAMEGRSRAGAGKGWNKGYPGRYGKGHKIVGLHKLDSDIKIYFAGVDEDPDKGLVTCGGRVLHIIAGGETLEAAAVKAYRNIRKLSFVDHHNNDGNCLRFRKSIAA